MKFKKNIIQTIISIKVLLNLNHAQVIFSNLYN